VMQVGEIESVASATDDVIAEMIIHFPGGEVRTTRIRLRRNTKGNWDIHRVLAGKTDQGASFEKKGR
jgi:hypothetical protein